MTKFGALPPLPGRQTAETPSHLEETERGLWASLIAEHKLADPGSLAILRTAMEAHQRSRRCREAIDRDGEAIKDRFGQIKPHPLLPAERDARAAFLAGMKALKLEVT